jgi:putative transposase
MGVMNIHSIVPKPNTSKPREQPRKKHGIQAHKVYPYLLRNLKINRANQVWATDITYIPIMDWYSRKVLSWCLSNSMDTLSEAIALYGRSEIFNTDQVHSLQKC